MILKYFSYLPFLVFTFWGLNITAQETNQLPIDGSVIEFGIGLGTGIPMADMKDRYGSHLNFSLGGNYILPSNWLFNVEFNYLYGEKIKEDVLAPFRTNIGTILGDDEQIADVFLRERGLFLGGGIGKLFPLSSNSRSGIKVMVDGGVLQHAIKFHDERNAATQVRAGRHAGFDRLTRGFALKETLAYKHMSSDKRVNFEVAFDATQGFTSEVRAYNFDTGLPTIKSRLDVILGMRIVWHLTFYTGGSDATIYY